ncbi:hypothetical protein [Brucella pseudogrignonensis]|uniref:Uncharacterized protein n=1 Tax=Brucella pseudogrignonensis TaxID=419475 RepID=A0ABU1M6B1_9HYPH|nr:hypothetical protein [Brucella pseudogrignonensis]MDR6431544.1 hypothetical protein [Brucella pseudogrignonensis]
MSKAFTWEILGEDHPQNIADELQLYDPQVKLCRGGFRKIWERCLREAVPFLHEGELYA